MNNWPKRKGIALPCAASYACPIASYQSIAQQHKINQSQPTNHLWFGNFSEIKDHAWRTPAPYRTVFRRLAKTLIQGDTLYITHPRIVINAAKDLKPLLELDFDIIFCWKQCAIINHSPSESLQVWLDGLAGPNKGYKYVKTPPYAAYNTPSGMKWDQEHRDIMAKIVDLHDNQHLSFRAIHRTINHPKIKCHKGAKLAYLYEKAYRLLNIRYPQEFDRRLMPDEQTLINAKTPQKPSLSTLARLKV